MRETDIDPDSLNRGAKCNQCGETTYAGTEACPDCGSEDMNTEWNSLLSNYDLHDVGEAYFTKVMEEAGLIVEEWGIDKRHNDDGLIFDNKMDLRLWKSMQEQEEVPPNPNTDEHVSTEWNIGLDTVSREWNLRGVVDIKTKASESWFGRFNLRHLAHYTEWADHYTVPTLVYMTMVDEESCSVGEKDFLLPITTDWDYKTLVDHYDNDSVTQLTYGEIKDVARECDIVERVFRAPDGNLVLETEPKKYKDFNWLMGEVL